MKGSDPVLDEAVLAARDVMAAGAPANGEHLLGDERGEGLFGEGIDGHGGGVGLKLAVAQRIGGRGGKNRFHPQDASPQSPDYPIWGIQFVPDTAAFSEERFNSTLLI